MQDGLKLRVGRQELIERIRRDEARWRMAGEIAPTPVVAEPIADHGLRPACDEPGLEHRPDETGAAGDQDHLATL